MVRNYKRRTMQGRTDAKTMLEAARCVRLHGISRRQVSREYGIKYRTLSKYIRKFSDDDIYGSNATPSINVGYGGSNTQILPANLEKKLVEYVIRATNICFGLTTVQIRKMSYELANCKSLRVPAAWNESKMAGCDWYKYFMKRHPALQANMTKIMSVSRSNNYGQTKIDMFFSKLEVLMKRCQFRPGNIWGMHECGVSMMDVPNRVVIRGYGHAKSHHGLVTLTATICADGDRMQPIFIFPTEEIYQREEVDEDEKPEIIKASNWMDEGKFLDYLKQFVKYSRCSKKNPCLLIMDNQYYLSVKAMDLAEEHGLVLLSFPQFCSHKLQPLLDKVVYDNFSKKVSELCKKWKTKHPRQELVEEDIQQLVVDNYKQIFPASIIKAAFKNRGIYPLNKLILSQVESEEVRSKAADYGEMDAEVDDDDDDNSDNDEEDEDDDGDEDFSMGSNVFYENTMNELMVDQPSDEVNPMKEM